MNFNISLDEILKFTPPLHLFIFTFIYNFIFIYHNIRHVIHTIHTIHTNQNKMENANKNLSSNCWHKRLFSFGFCCLTQNFYMRPRKFSQKFIWKSWKTTTSTKFKLPTVWHVPFAKIKTKTMKFLKRNKACLFSWKHHNKHAYAGKRKLSSKVGKTFLQNFFAMLVIAFVVFVFNITIFLMHLVEIFNAIAFIVLSICKNSKYKVYLCHLLHITVLVFFFIL